MTRPLALTLLLVTSAATVAPAQSTADVEAQGQAASEAAQREAWEHHQAKRYAEAARDYRKAIASWPENRRALNNLAWLLLTAEDPAARDPQAALPLAERAAELAPDDEGTLDTLATAYDAVGRHLEAARLQLRVVRLDPQTAEFGDRLRDFAARALSGDPPGALRAELAALRARGELSRAPKPKRLRALLAELSGGEPSALGHAVSALILQRLGKRDAELATAAAAALAAGSREPGLARLQGQALRRLGRLGEAARALEAATGAEPGDYELRLLTARVHAQARQHQELARVVEQAVADLERVHPLWEGKWAARLRAVEAKAHAAEVAAIGTRNPSLAREHRVAELRARVRGVAARAESHEPEGAIWSALQTLGHPAAEVPVPARRRALAEELLGQRDLPRFVDGSDRLEVRKPGGRLAFADVDGDGDPDLLLRGAVLLLNDGRGRFTRARESGIRGGARGGVFADVDQDGDLDLFTPGGGPDRLYLNHSTPQGVRFEDVTAEWAEGLDDGLPSEGAAWGDVNGDGYPDLYLANYQQDAKHIDTGTPDRLWLSVGGRGFRPAHDLIQQTPLLCGRGVSPADIDQDGDLDLFVSNYRLDRDLLFVNAGGTLHERGRERGVAGVLQRGAYGHTIGSAWGDLDLDGDLDLVCANLAHPRFIDVSDPTCVYLQQPDGRFREVRQELGIWFEETHSHPVLWDLDDDGDLDLTLTSTYGGRPSTTWRNRAVEDGRLRFEDVTWGTSTRVFNGWGAACADVDLDGDLDFAVAAQGGVRLWLNQGDGRGNRSVRLRLEGTRSDSWGAYATCTLTLGDGRRLVRQLNLGSGTTCQSEPILHFGVGRDPGPFALSVRWPQGATSTLRVGPGLHTVREPAGIAAGPGPAWTVAPSPR